MSIFYFLVIPLIACKYYFSDSSSYEIDSSVVENEKKIAVRQLNKEYNIQHLTYDSSLLTSLIKLPNTELDFNPDAHLKQEILMDTISIVVTKKSAKMDHPAYYYFVNVIRPTRQDTIVYLHIPLPSDIDNRDDVRTIRNILKIKNKDLQSDLSIYRRQEVRIWNNNFWTYNSLLPYFITSQNIKPKSRATNYLYFLHEKLFWGIMLTLIMGIILSKIMERP